MIRSVGLGRSFRRARMASIASFDVDVQKSLTERIQKQGSLPESTRDQLWEALIGKWQTF